MKNQKSLLLNAVFCLMCGCASHPDYIPALYISETKYNGVSCDELISEHDKIVQAYYWTERRQTSAAVGDALSTATIGLPVAGTYNVAYEVARLKGEILAIRRVAVKKGCSLKPLPPDIVLDGKPAPISKRNGPGDILVR
jgi:hypothetical protein